MTLTQLNKAIETMRSVYPFKDDETFLTGTRDIVSNMHDRIEICTKDEKTGVEITMAMRINGC